MTTYIPFIPSTVSAPIFQPTFDGNPYSVTVFWNLYSQRYYLICYDFSGNLIFNRPMMTSPPAIEIDTLTWDISSQQVTATCSNPHGFAIGSIVQLQIEGVTPDDYNGNYDCLVLDQTTFQYTLTLDPGYTIQPGQVSYLINLIAGYFASTMVFRNNNFEITP